MYASKTDLLKLFYYNHKHEIEMMLLFLLLQPKALKLLGMEVDYILTKRILVVIRNCRNPTKEALYIPFAFLG